MRSYTVRTLILSIFFILIGSLFCLILIGVTDCFGEQYTSGSGYFAISEKHLKKAIRLDRKGYYESLVALINTGAVRRISQGIPVEIYTYRSGIYRVKFPNSSTIWWTSERALMNRGEENMVR